jgi:hypothetical protein
MRHRYLVLGLSAFLALALAVPALGGPSNPVADVSATAKKTAKKALKKSKKAQQSADAAQQSANQAQNAAEGAQGTADGAQTAAEAAQAAADAAQATANGKFGSTQFVQGETSVEDSALKANTAACPGSSVPTGGGYAIGGSEPEDATVGFSGSPLYGGGWSATARPIDGEIGTWTITATAVCASP